MFIFDLPDLDNLIQQEGSGLYVATRQEIGLNQMSARYAKAQ
jgi:hypothetical protein